MNYSYNKLKKQKLKLIYKDFMKYGKEYGLRDEDCDYLFDTFSKLCKNKNKIICYYNKYPKFSIKLFVKYIDKFKKIEILDLKNNYIGDEEMIELYKNLSNLRNLISLNISRNNLRRINELNENLKYIPKLQLLDISCIYYIYNR